MQDARVARYPYRTVTRDNDLVGSIFDRVPIMMAMYEPTTKVLRLNREFERIVGWSTEEARHVDLMERCYPDPAYRERVRQHMMEPRPTWLDLRMTTKDGRVIETSWVNIRLADDARLGIGIEIGDRKQQLHVLETLYGLAAFVGRAGDTVEIHEAAVDAMVAATGAARTSLLVFDPDGVLRFKAWRGLSERYRAAVEGHSPWSASDEDPPPILVPDVLAEPGLAALRDVIVAEGVRAVAFIPLVYQRRLLGKFMLYYDGVHAFTDEEVHLAATIAHHAAFALERARVQAAIAELLERERAARADAEAAERRARFLAEASRVLSSSLDHATTLREVARLAVPEFADGCCVDLLAADGALQRLAITHRDPAKEALGWELWRRYPPRPDHPIHRALRAGKTQLFPRTDDAVLAALAHDAQHLAMMRQLDARSALAVPLAVRGRVLGALLFICGGESGRVYREPDVALAEELARRAAQAIENARLYSEVEVASRAKDDFLAMLAHELRNPLGVVVNALAVLEHPEGGEQGPGRARYLIRRQVQHLTRLLDDLLDVARITRGRVDLRPERLDLRVAVDLAVEAQRHRIEAKRQALDVRLAGGPVMVFGDPARLQQIIGNLLNNACKYTPDGGRITLTLVVEGAEAVLTVTDDGIGIPADRLNAIFDPFTQLEPGLARTEGGLGIGLTLVRQLVELHGGSVRAVSPGAGCGAQFVVRLPLTTARSSAPAAAPAPEPAAERRSIVLIEDNDDAREVLALALEMDGHRVWSARTGRDGLALAQRERPDLVLVDIGLPDMDGYAVCRALRDTGGRDVVVIALSGYGQPEDRQRSAHAGFDGHVVKPVEPQTLMRLVAEIASPRA
ncbi:MAG TPA: ATP-binding protein [Methylomirabilota bacterium]|nr:ATP-binding protein [Methylomirabilota bacterium]